MDVILLGTGCPVAHPDRAGAATLIASGQTSVLIDCGSGVTQQLVSAGLNGAGIDALLLTHLHSDHLIDFYQLVVSSWHQGRDRPWRIYASPDVAAFVRANMALWADERRQRIAYEKRPSARGLDIEIEEIGAGRKFEVGPLSVTVVEVDHRPIQPAFGFVFKSRGQCAVVSGDTKPCDELIEAGRGCDLLVHEVFMHRQMAPVPTVRSQETIDAVSAYHTRSDEVGAVAARMQAKALALTHFVPPVFDRAELIAEVAQSFDGPIFIGEDLMRFHLATGDLSFGRFRGRILPGGSGWIGPVRSEPTRSV